MKILCKIYIIGRVHADNKEATETYLVNTIVKINITREIGNVIGNIAVIPPAAVATPFPPLNENHIGKICPNIMAIIILIFNKSLPE